jgi:2-polyprenyl-3-methyl-5-hydroxy-6-metoxy-1,4-benzoquinol methylase
VALFGSRWVIIDDLRTGAVPKKATVIAIHSSLEEFIVIRRILNRLKGARPAPEPLMYRVHLFEELVHLASSPALAGRRILEIGPKDGLDTRRLAGLGPSELVVMDLPHRRAEVEAWLPSIPCPVRCIVANFNYLSPADLDDLGQFDVIWCTGVLYHNAEQLRFLRKLYKRLVVGGRLVLESATLRGNASLRGGRYVEIHYPDTYRGTGTMTHLPSRGAIRAWLGMVGFKEIQDSACYRPDNRNLVEHRYACICRKTGEDDGDAYYAVSPSNPPYRYGDAT